MSERLRVGVVGLGIGAQHAAAWAELSEQFELVALCDLDEARATRAAERFGAVGTYTDFRRLLDEVELDVVDICTPPHLHFEQVQAALASGRHVVCEKPLVRSLAEADALERAESDSGRRLMPIFQYRFGAGVQKLRHLVRNGLTGRAYLSTIETAWRRGAPYYAVEWRGRWKTELGGVLLSHAIHAHDLLCYVVGPVKSVFARTATRVNPIETEDCASVSLEMADGSLASLSATLGSTVEISRLRFCFEEVTAESSLAPYAPSFEPWSFEAASEESGARIAAALDGFDAGHSLYTGQFERFHRALAAGEVLPVSVADARAALELVTAMYHSAETREVVELPLDSTHPRYESWLPVAAAQSMISPGKEPERG